jgi:hypothetical protein
MYPASLRRDPVVLRHRTTDSRRRIVALDRANHPRRCGREGDDSFSGSRGQDTRACPQTTPRPQPRAR